MAATLFPKGLFKVSVVFSLLFSGVGPMCGAQQLALKSLGSTGTVSRGHRRQTCFWVVTCRLRRLRPGRSRPAELRWPRPRPSAPVVPPAASEATPAELALPAVVGP